MYQLKDSKDYQIVIINSQDRKSGTSSNFLIDLNSPITRSSEIKVVSVQIPYTYYAINTRNNTLRLTTGSTTIPVGNYGVSQLISTLQSAAGVIAGAPYTFTYSYITNKITISAGGGFGVLTTGANNIAMNLGFTINSAIGTSVTSDGTVDISGTRYINIKSSVLTQFNYRPTISASALSQTIMYTVPVDRQPWDMIVHKTSSDLSRISVNSRESRFYTGIDFSLEDDAGNLLDLNGANWSMQLLFSIR